MRRLLCLCCVLPVFLQAAAARDVHTPPLLRTIDNGVGAWDLAISPDGALLAVGGFDGSLKIWNLRTGGQLFSIPAHEQTTAAVAFHPKSQHVATAGADGTVKLWNVATGKLVTGIRAYEGAVTDLAFSPDGRQIVSGGLDGRWAAWEYERGAAGFKANSHIEIEKGQGLVAFEMVHPGVATVDVSPDGTLLAIGGTTGRVTLHSYPADHLVGQLLGHTQGLNRAAFSADGKRFITASLDNSARVWDVQSQRELHRLGGYMREVLCATFSPDGKWVAVASRDHHVDVWDAETGVKLMSLPENRAGVFAVTFSPIDRWMVTGGWDDAIQIWDVGKMPR